MSNDDTGTHVVIITGLSGAGRSQTSNILEDIGYFVVDNLPTVLISDLVSTVGSAEGDRSRVAVVTDTRTGVDETDLDLALIDLHRDGIRTTVLFLDADDNVLAWRFEETRRPHPADGASLGDAIANERAAFEPVRGLADVVVDTSELNVHQLKEKIRDAFSGVEAVPSMRVDVSSFGFKRGTPRVVDIMFDVRFLPNPHWEPELRPQTGLDAPVRDYVFQQYEAGEFLARTTEMLDFLLPYYEAEGKSYLTIAVGCTGGRHRSVALAEALAAHLRESGVETSLNHREHRSLMRRTETEAQTLLQQLEDSMEGPAVVAIGGGQGLSRVLRAALAYASRVDAVVTVADDGGSSGRLAPHLDIPPPGDIRKCLLALTPEESSWKSVFDYRFQGADVAGHSLGNLILAGLADIEGSFEEALIRAEQLLGTEGSVIPACGEHLRLEIDSDGELVMGQVAVSLHRGPVDSIRVRPGSAAATPRAIRAIESADQVILGPGSLMTSTIAAMRVPGITEAINRAEADLVYVGNLVTQDGETLGMDGIDHLDALLRLTGVRPPRTIVANNRRIDVIPPLGTIEFDREITATYGADLALSDLVEDGEPWPSHDPGKLGDALRATTR